MAYITINQTLTNHGSLVAVGSTGRNRAVSQHPDRLAPGVEEAGEGFGDAVGVVDDDWAVCPERGDGQGHGHPVVMIGGIFTTL